jgi:CRISP-associated protein Cas1
MPTVALERIEPMRRVVDGAIRRLIANDAAHAGDFTITSEGVCRLNPQLARKLVAVTSAAIAI